MQSRFVATVIILILASAPLLAGCSDADPIAFQQQMISIDYENLDLGDELVEIVNGLGDQYDHDDMRAFADRLDAFVAESDAVLEQLDVPRSRAAADFHDAFMEYWTFQRRIISSTSEILHEAVAEQCNVEQVADAVLEFHEQLPHGKEDRLKENIIRAEQEFGDYYDLYIVSPDE